MKKYLEETEIINWNHPEVQRVAEKLKDICDTELALAKKCVHMGGKVVVPTQEFITKLIAARLAADICGVPTILIARTDAETPQT